VRTMGTAILEQQYEEKYRLFREKVTSKINVHFFATPQEVKLAVLGTLQDHRRNPDLIGWISAAEGIDQALKRRLEETLVMSETLRHEMEELGKRYKDFEARRCQDYALS